MKRPEHDPLEDRAWAALRARLDQEMPEKTRKRRALWWFLLLIPAGLLGWLLVRPAAAPDGPGRAPQPSAVAPVALQPAVPEQAPGASGPSLIGTLSGLETEPARQSTVVGLHKTRKGKPRVEAPARPRQSAEPDAVLTPVTVPERHSTLPNGSSVIASLPHVEPPMVWARLDTLPTLPADALTANIQPHPDKRPPFAPFLAVQTGWSDVPRPDEVGMLAGVDWQPGGASFGLRAGLAYRYANAQTAPPSLVRLEEQSKFPDFLESVDTQIPGSTNSLTPGGDLLEVPVTHRHILEMPVQVFWQPRSAFRVYAGVAPGYVLGVQTDDVGRYNEEKLVRLNRSASLRRQVLQEDSRWLAPGLFGAGFRWGRRWEATAMWRTSGSVHAGLQYRFGPR